MFGPNLPRTKKNKPKRKKTKSFDGKSRKAKERRTFQRQKRRRKKTERQQRIEAKREANRQEQKQRRAEGGEPPVKKVKSKKDPKSHHGAEYVGPDVSFKEFSNIKEFSNTKSGTMSTSDKQDMTNSPWLQSSSAASMERPVKKKSKRYVKRRPKQTSKPGESSDEDEDEKPKRQRRRKSFLRRFDPSLTESSGAETPYLADDDEEVSRAAHVYGELKGGAGLYEDDLSMTELMRIQIL